MLGQYIYIGQANHIQSAPALSRRLNRIVSDDETDTVMLVEPVVPAVEADVVQQDATIDEDQEMTTDSLALVVPIETATSSEPLPELNVTVSPLTRPPSVSLVMAQDIHDDLSAAADSLPDDCRNSLPTVAPEISEELLEDISPDRKSALLLQLTAKTIGFTIQEMEDVGVALAQTVLSTPSLFIEDVYQV